MHHRYLLFFLMRRGRMSSGFVMRVVLLVGAAVIALTIIGTMSEHAPPPDVSGIETQAFLTAESAGTVGSNFVATADPSGNLVVTETLPTHVNYPLAVVQSDCFLVQHALWQESMTGRAASIEVDILWTVSGAIGGTETREIALCNLGSTTVQGFTWTTPDAAWVHYTSTWTTPGL